MTDTRTLIAFNTATASENKIHDDVVASRFGFTGGLVPGVDVFAYMAHMPAKKWGARWLRSGRMQGRFIKPVYDGDSTIVRASDVTDGIDLSVLARGVLCATGFADLKPTASPHKAFATVRMPSAEDREPASPKSLAVGATLGTLREIYTQEEGLAHIEAVRDDPDLYDDGRVANAGWLLRRANYVLAENVKLGPWIHVESAISFHDLLTDGEELEVRAVVADNVESKGHLMVVLDIQMSAAGRFIATCRHWAIYEPRQVRMAG